VAATDAMTERSSPIAVVVQNTKRKKEAVMGVNHQDLEEGLGVKEMFFSLQNPDSLFSCYFCVHAIDVNYFIFLYLLCKL